MMSRLLLRMAGRPSLTPEDADAAAAEHGAVGQAVAGHVRSTWATWVVDRLEDGGLVGPGQRHHHGRLPGLR